MIDKIKDYEGADDMRTTKDIEDMKRWSKQGKQLTIKILTDEELLNELKNRNIK